MKQVFKYPLRITDTQSLELPVGAEILSVQVQFSTVQLWALVDTSQPKEKREIEIYGTGHPMHDAERKFIGTVQLEEGRFVFHVFERNPK